MPPPVKNFLTFEQVSKLQKGLKDSKLPHVRERILFFCSRMISAWSAQFFSCSPRTVAYWCMHGDRQTTRVCIINETKRNYQQLTYIQLLLETIGKPAELGYEFGRWTGERLATYLATETGISQVHKWEDSEPKKV